MRLGVHMPLPQPRFVDFDVLDGRVKITLGQHATPLCRPIPKYRKIAFTLNRHDPLSLARRSRMIDSSAVAAVFSVYVAGVVIPGPNFVTLGIRQLKR
ncbi:hypothetical protein WI73_13095 [Burkholderia ubonensis]|nr:hypothetical protein WI73_13095 [Burkholderia ubonensis]